MYKYLIVLASIIGVYGCNSRQPIKHLPMFNYFIPKGDTTINGTKMKLSIRSIKLIDDKYYVGYYLNNNPFGSLFIFDESDSILREIRNFMLWDTSVVMESEDDKNDPTTTPIINSNYIFQKDRIDSIKSEYSYLYKESDSVFCIHSNIDGGQIFGADIYIEKKDSSLFRVIQTNEKNKCFEYKDEDLESKRNYILLIASNDLDSTQKFSHYKIIEKYFNYSEYTGFHINDLKAHYESGKKDVLYEFYKAVISGESYFNEIDERNIYVPEQKGEMPEEIKKLRYEY